MPKAPAKAKANKKTELFKTRKSRESQREAEDTITPSEEIAAAVDAFREAQEQMKHYEGEMTIHKDLLIDFSQDEFSKRLLKGKTKSFKILGENSMVTYVVMDSSAGLTEEDVEAFKERWGEKAADELITRDLASVRFDGEVFEANYDEISNALQKLPKDILESLFKPMLMKAKSGAAEKAKKFAKNAEELKEILQNLKMKNYIR